MATIDAGPDVVADERIFDEVDSCLGSEAASSSQTLNSSILDYRRENGRTYHRYKDGKYNLPNDDMENERLDLQHHLFLLTFNDKLGLAPPNSLGSKVQRVLDLGTGTGIWAMDFGDEHPGAQVIGVDLSPNQPTFVPPNVQFYVDDIDEEWNHSQPFDYIHSRMMTSSIASWSDYLRKIFNNLTPGGYAELQEADVFVQCDDGTLNTNQALPRCLQLMYEASVKFGRPYQDITQLKDIMAEVGFVDIVETRSKWPTNTWPRDKRFKELGAWNNTNIDGGLEAFTMAPLTRACGWKQNEVHVFLVDVRRDLNDKGIHAYWPVYSISGRKPDAAV